MMFPVRRILARVAILACSASAAQSIAGRPDKADPLGAIAAAVRKLGLRLESARGPEAFIIIDHMERPSEN
jgi:uncharacterized protein (TIGR03435 family)